MTHNEPMYERHNMEPRIVETFTVLDLDRTLLDSDTLVGLLYNELQKLGIPADELNLDQAFARDQTGNSFSLLEHLVHEYGQELVTGAMQSVRDLAQNGELPAEAIVCPGANELLDYLDDNNIPHAILTFGENDYQQFKIEVVRAVLGKTEATLPATITSEPKKAEWISHTWEGDGSGERFHVPVSISGDEQIQASYVVVVDDKSSNITSQNEHVKGILVNNTQVRPTGSLSTADLAEYLQAGLSLGRISDLQLLNAH